MKKNIIAASLALATLSGAAFAEVPAAKIVIVNQATVLDGSKAALTLKADMDKKRQEFQKEMVRYEKELKAKEAKLIAEKDTLSEADFAKKASAFEKRLLDIQGRLEVRRVQLEEGYNTASSKVLTALLQAADTIKKTEGANIVLNVEQTLVVDRTLDISGKVVSQMNKDFPSVKVSFKSEAEIKKQMKK